MAEKQANTSADFLKPVGEQLFWRRSIPMPVQPWTSWNQWFICSFIQTTSSNMNQHFAFEFMNHQWRPVSCAVEMLPRVLTVIRPLFHAMTTSMNQQFAFELMNHRWSPASCAVEMQPRVLTVISPLRHERTTPPRTSNSQGLHSGIDRLSK